MFKHDKNGIQRLYLCIIFTVIIFLILFLSIISNIAAATRSNQEILSYTVGLRSVYEKLDVVFERAEVNVNVMTESIANSYDIRKQQDKVYNLNFVDNTDGLVQSVLSNTPNADGAWFQLNADLPFSTHAYNWFEFKGNEFIDIKDTMEGTPSIDREITPEADPYYFSAIQAKGLSWSDIYTDADTKEQMITVSAPIYRAGALVGVAGIDISTASLKQILRNMQLMLNDSEFYLLDKKNNPILMQLLPGMDSSKADTSFLSLFEDHSEGIAEYTKATNKKTAILLPMTNGYKLVITANNKTLFSKTNNLVNIIYIMFALLVLSTTFAFINQFELSKQKAESIIPQTDQEEEETQEE